ncbi:hypothetical protein KP509_05G054500 [Ceratopteris richardii]|uniref:Phospholipase D n=1 Tax=Ceratopteris richardii TaxID=49495 RepID=A0A8T2UR36_CERRI|nr:hypothetical protein KP509_05G054500 [Ceratopteris richardii]
MDSCSQGPCRDDNVPTRDSAWKPVLLYGKLDVTIHNASNLPNMDSLTEGFRKCLTLCQPCIKTIPNVDVDHMKRRITSDPYVCVVLQDATVARTRVVRNSADPKWDEHFEILVAHTVSEVDIIVKDDDIFGAEFIGQVKIRAESLYSQEIEGSFQLCGKDGKPLKAEVKLQVSMKYCPVEKDPLYKDGVGKGPDYKGVPRAYFPLRKGGRVTLYQDAHVPDGMLPEIELEGGLKFEHRKCWEEICEAIQGAHHLVYIAGWSIYTKTKLIRKELSRDGDGVDLTLGELLKNKAHYETARVLLLVWDDKSSHSVINNVGVMGTHDEETRRFFKHSNVKCLLAPRYADTKISWFKQKVVGTLYTHHQKLVIVDAQGPGNTRQLVAYIGGLDLCDGRFDTPDHTLFKSLDTVFADDFHNPTFAKTDGSGPRQPWHDLHCKIEGAAAYDVYKNFEQRWWKAAKWHGLRMKYRKGLHWSDNVFVDLERVPWIVSPKQVKDGRPATTITSETDPETWHVQVFRSIDSGSVKGFPKRSDEIEKANLVGGKNLAIDMSIHTAYIKAIRSAQHFIYIENQYFIGSSFGWPAYKNAGANNLIPIEIALKIVSKIKANEDFRVYIVIPMWPEGVPTSTAMQEILFFQTMEMMYTHIANALREMGKDKDHQPTDYLNFFCLGNREMEGDKSMKPAPAADDKSPLAQVQRSRRFMIYVHAKGIIIDDEYIILGSANINQRSMDGSRDTEIAMGAYQPHYSWAQKGHHPQGQVYGYRISLWTEHLRCFEECFKRPWTLDCVKRVRDLGIENWNQYVDEKVTDMKGHLMCYPLDIQPSGKVVPMKGYETFPDIGGKIIGSSTNLPDGLTT